MSDQHGWHGRKGVELDSWLLWIAEGSGNRMQATRGQLLQNKAGKEKNPRNLLSLRTRMQSCDIIVYNMETDSADV